MNGTIELNKNLKVSSSSIASTNSIFLKQGWLCLIYLLVPLAFIITVIDNFFLDDYIRDHALLTPLFWVRLTFLLSYPHIFSSFFVLIDDEYFSQYRNKLLYYCPFIFLIGTLAPATRFWYIAFPIGIIINFNHVIGQQVGILKLLGRRKTWDILFFRINFLIIALLLYYYAFGTIFIHIKLPLFIDIKSIILFFIFLFSIVSTTIFFNLKSAYAKTYLILNVAMLFSMVWFVKLQYHFLALLVPRLVHDISAFSFYSIHDANKNFPKSKSFLYKTLKLDRFGLTKPVLALIITPLVAILCSLPFVLNIQIKEISYFLSGIGFLHFYTESFSWKKDSVQRKYLKIKAD